jgi:hypothetical protein
MTDGHALDLAFLAWLRTATIEDLIRARDDCAIDFASTELAMLAAGAIE